ncbi:MAG: hypothetical protein ACRD00_05095 [Thermoanaerobaculia bacterium]
MGKVLDSDPIVVVLDGDIVRLSLGTGFELWTGSAWVPAPSVRPTSFLSAPRATEDRLAKAGVPPAGRTFGSPAPVRS